MEIREWALGILYSNDLESKVFFPEKLTDFNPGLTIEAPLFPGRPKELMPGRGTKVSLPTSLESPSTRGILLHHFANHELLALELMALTLLRFPDMPQAMRRTIASTLHDEQTHLKLYIKRMNELGVSFGSIPVNNFFWRTLSKIDSPLNYFAGMSLTFEQANLDYASYYINQFAVFGDNCTSNILRQIHDDEVNHVKVGVSWIQHLDSSKKSLWKKYCSAVPWPLTPQYSKGKNMHIKSRLDANLDPEFIEELRLYTQSKGRTPNVYWFNSDAEIEIASGTKYVPKKAICQLMEDLELLPMLLAASDDIVLLRTLPRQKHLGNLADAGLNIPEFIQSPNSSSTAFQDLRARRIGHFKPWGITPSSHDFAQSIGAKSLANWDNSCYPKVYPKTSIITLRDSFRARHLSLLPILGHDLLDGSIATSVSAIEKTIELNETYFSRPSVIKSPYGASGQNTLLINSTNELHKAATISWLEKQFEKFGSVLVEPWLEKIADFSAQFRFDRNRPDPLVTIGRFLTNSRGQYIGHYLGKVTSSLDSELKTLLSRRHSDNISILDAMNMAAMAAQESLQDLGYEYAASLDMFLFKNPKTGHLNLRAIGEINPRFTMGHIAHELSCKMNGVKGWFLLITSRQLRNMGFESFMELSNSLNNLNPLEVDSRGNLRNGVLFLTDPDTARSVVAIVVCNKLPDIFKF